MPEPKISVIIPTLNEASTIVACLTSLRGQAPDEIVVVDADSPDGTADLARVTGATVYRSPRGRGVQQNRGAEEATGDVLLFLHADCRLAPGALARMRFELRRSPRLVAGCFRMRVADPDPRFRLIDAAAHIRAGVLGLPYGDQGIFVRRGMFARAGGFPEVPLMEDLMFAFRVRRLARFALLPAAIDVSPRRWRRTGLIRQTLRNWDLTLRAALGVPPSTLKSRYPEVR